MTEILVTLQKDDGSITEQIIDVALDSKLGELREVAHLLLGLPEDPPCRIILERTGKELRDNLTVGEAGIQHNDKLVLFPCSVSTDIGTSQSEQNNTTLSSLKDWQKAALTGGVIGMFLLIGLLLTRQQALPPQPLPQPPVPQPPRSPTPDISPQFEYRREPLEEPTSSSDTTLQPTITPVPNPTFYSPPLPSISQQEAVDLIYKWLEYKRRIFAPPYQRDLGDEILTGKAHRDNIRRSDGQESSLEWLENHGAYYTYGVQSIDSVENFAASGNQATIDVVVTEQRTLYNSNGNIDRNASAFDTRLVRYNLQSDNGAWKIGDYHIVKTISKK